MFEKTSFVAIARPEINFERIVESLLK